MGSRNYLEILPSVVCANDVALEIEKAKDLDKAVVGCVVFE